jgi:ElaB/YqjD/DUF883 family membrane-anchored ribosome-binding protein
MASILDVFNASARLASQGLDMYSQEQKYHLDTELYKQAQDLDLLQNRLAEDLYKPDATGQMPFLNKPDEYRRYVEKSLAEWNRNAVAAGNGSRYYNDSLNRIALQGQTAMGKKVYAAEQVAARQQFLIDLQKNIQNEYNNPDREKGLANALGHRQNGLINNVIGPEAGMKLENEIVNTFFGKEGAYQDNGTDTVAEGRQTVKTQLDDYEKSLRETYKINPDEHIEDKRIKTEAYLRAAETAIQDRNYNQLDMDAKDWQQKINDYLEHAPGWENLFPQIVTGWFSGRAEVDAGTEGNRQSEYADDKKPTMKSMFRWDERLGKRPGEEKWTVDAAMNNFSSEWIQHNKYLDALQKEEAGYEDSNGFSIQKGLDISQIDKELWEMNVANGWGLTVTELQTRFTSKVLSDFASETNVAAGKTVLMQMLQLNESEWEAVIKKSGLTKSEINRDMMVRVFNANAEYARMNALAGDNGTLQKEAREYYLGQLTQIKNTYTGKNLDISDQVKYDPQEGASSYKRGINDFRNLAGVIKQMEGNAALIQQDWQGNGVAMSRINDDTLRASLSEMGDILNSFPDAKAVAMTGDTVVMTAGDGNRYRLTERDGQVQLRVREGDEWTPKAELAGKAGRDFLWLETDTNGNKVKDTQTGLRGEAAARKTIELEAAEREARQAAALIREAARMKDSGARERAEEALREAQKKLSDLRNLSEDYFRYRPFTGLGLGGGK